MWLAKRKSDGGRVAIKCLNIASVKTWKKYELFKREASILQSLCIEGVVPFYEYIEDLENHPPLVCIVQKFIEGQTLADMLKAKHRFLDESIYDIIAQVLRILQSLHEHQPPVIHRDIKPSNLMLTPVDNGKYKVTLLDFGAVANPQIQTGGSTVAGTFGYMPPEQLMGQAQPGSDIYALAAVAVELLSGTSPADIEVCDFRLVIEPYLTHVSPEVVQTLNLMLEPSVHHRHCDHTALIAQFDALANKRQPSFLNFLRQTIPKLNDVNHICQPGNYEIWQNLDQTRIPPLEKCPCHLNIKKTNKAFKNITHQYNVILTFFIPFVVFIIVMFMVSKLMPLDVYLEEPDGVVPMAVQHAITVLHLFGFAVAVTIASFVSKKLSLYKKIEFSSDLPLKRISLSDWNDLKCLLASGQKVVGKIVSIRYVRMESIYINANGDSKKDGDDSLFFVYGIPQFVVKYKFQYGDKKDYEYYGELATHTLPEDHYKVGDPITLVVNLDNPNSYISAMPYPYPYGDVMKKYEILDEHLQIFNLNNTETS